MKVFLVVGNREGVPYEDPGAQEPVTAYRVQSHALKAALVLHDCVTRPDRYVPNSRGGREFSCACGQHVGEAQIYDSYEVLTMELQ